MDFVDHVLESMDLTSLFTLLTLVAFFLALYVMQLTSSQHEDAEDPPWIRWSRRSSLGGLCLALLWSLSYSLTKQWQPWPPSLALLLTVIAILVVRAMAIHAHIRRDAARRGIAMDSNISGFERVRVLDRN